MSSRWRPLIVVAASLLLAGCPDPVDTCEANPTAPTCRQEPPPRARTLPIAAIAQQTPVWCWAATAEMVFRHYAVPNLNPAGNFQCGIVGAYFMGACAQNCGLCVAPIQGMAELNRLIQQYGLLARQFGFASPVLQSRLLFRFLSVAEIAGEIDAGRPIVAGISAGGFPFPNFSQHVVVIVGYESTPSGDFVFVNDPFPYNLPQFVLQGAGNPYLSVGATEVLPGRYRVSHSAFVSALVWANTIDQIRP